MNDLNSLLDIGLGGMGLGSLTIGLLALVILVTVWKLVWYGIALYKTIERKQLVWFVVLFIATFLLSDLGILAIVYLLIYRKKSSIQLRRPTKSSKRR